MLALVVTHFALLAKVFLNTSPSSLITKVSKSDDDAAVGRLRVERFQAAGRQREYSRLRTINGPRQPIKPSIG